MRRILAFPAMTAALLTSMAWQDTATACTTFCLRDAERVVFGRNYDFVTGDGHLLVNKRNVAKTSVLTADRPDSWVSKHGSVTFNQFGREYPTGGINEKGLVVELMWLDGTRYPPVDSRPAVGVLEWIQLQLDTAGSVDELLARIERTRIRGDSPLHYLVADQSGAAATIEFLEGKPVVHSRSSLVPPVLANDVYQTSAAYLARHQGFGGSLPVPSGSGSLDRFTRAAAMIEAFRRDHASSPVQTAFDILDSVAQGEATRWSIVYDLTDRVVRFRTSTHRPIRFVQLSGLDFSCGAPVKMLDLDAQVEGDVTSRLAQLSSKDNLDLMLRSYARTPFLAGVPKERIEAAARHSESTQCLK